MISMIGMIIDGNGTEGVWQAWQQQLQEFGVEAVNDTAVIGFLE